MTISENIAEQTEQCIRNISQALTEAGSQLEDIIQVRYILPDGGEFRDCWPVLRKYFGQIRPAATMIVAGILDPRMKIEIEAMARKAS